MCRVSRDSPWGYPARMHITREESLGVAASCFLGPLSPWVPDNKHSLSATQALGQQSRAGVVD